MYLSLNWLKDLVNIPRSVTPEDLGIKLTMHTVEIDGVEKQSRNFDKVIVGKVLEVKKHPNADKLFWARVDTGKEKLSIVCGAPNLAKDQLVPVALPGAVLPNGMEIKEAEVRGELSQGMICAEDELGLGEDHKGIMVLGKKAKAGEPLAEYFQMDDILFEVDNKSITHRPDLWGHFGMAREIATFLNTKLSSEFRKIEKKEIKLDKDPRDLDIKIEAPDLCSRYMGLKIDNLAVEESPQWLQKRLTAVGMRPINNIVDVTNYVMLELGQPLHAFDSSLVDSIVVRRAKQGEKIITLDGEERELEESMLVIADKEKPIAIAGVMGGANSEVSTETTSIILESANFDPVSARKTAQRLGLRTEASMRFEKSLDPHLAETAIIRCANLLKKISPRAKFSGNITDVHKEKAKENNFSLNTAPIDLDLPWLKAKLGEELEEKKVIEILDNLGFKVDREEAEPKKLKVTVPSWRATKDISIPEDLVEEIVRIYGFDNLESKMPLVTMQAPFPNQERKIERKIKNLLSQGAAMSEVYNYAFTNGEKLQKMGIDSNGYIALANPLTNQHTLLRQNLITNLLDNIKTNQARFENLKFFEIGSVFLNLDGEINKKDKSEEKLPYQETRLGLVEAGEKETPFAGLKGRVEYLLNSFKFEVEYQESESPLDWSHPSSFARIKVGDKDLGAIYVLSPKVLNALGIKKKVAGAEINLAELVKLILATPEKSFQQENKFPSLVRDIAFVVDQKVLYNDLKKEIESFNNLVKSIELFDVYEGEKIGKNKKNLAFHITYQAGDRTLTAEEVQKVQDELTKHLEEKFEAQIRDF